VERIPGYKPPHLWRIIPGIQVIQPGLRVPPVPGVAVRVHHTPRAADMIPERVVVVRSHHRAGGVGQRHHVPVAVVVVVVGHAAAHHGQQLAARAVDVSCQQIAAAVGVVGEGGDDGGTLADFDEAVRGVVEVGARAVAGHVAVVVVSVTDTAGGGELVGRAVLVAGGGDAAALGDFFSQAVEPVVAEVEPAADSRRRSSNQALGLLEHHVPILLSFPTLAKWVLLYQL